MTVYVFFFVFFVLLSGRDRRCQRFLSSECFDTLRIKHAKENISWWQGIQCWTEAQQKRGVLCVQYRLRPFLEQHIDIFWG